MGNAIWLSLALPEWYFSTVVAPFSAGALSAIPAIGVVCLVIGSIWGGLKRWRELLVFSTMPIASQVLVAVAGFVRGAVEASASNFVLSVFLLFQLALAGYFVFRLKDTRPQALMLAVFGMSYAFFASFIASMAFGDVWL